MKAEMVTRGMWVFGNPLPAVEHGGSVVVFYSAAAIRANVVSGRADCFEVARVFPFNRRCRKLELEKRVAVRAWDLVERLRGLEEGLPEGFFRYGGGGRGDDFMRCERFDAFAYEHVRMCFFSGAGLPFANLVEQQQRRGE